MKQIGLIIVIFLIYSCNNKLTKDNKNNFEISTSDKSRRDSLTKIVKQFDNVESKENIDLSKVFIKAVKFFPNDSASLYRFYFKWNSTKNQEKINKQIKRLEGLITKESIERYRSIENNLKPLMIEIVNSNTVSKSQSDRLVKLYSDYDYFSSESLFSQLLTNDDNYKLVWQSFKIMAKESSKYGTSRFERFARSSIATADDRLSNATGRGGN